tara:strand:+ start:1064 stop:1894 length:831 start_codon:yes stop_codon:yes gene_type:complete
VQKLSIPEIIKKIEAEECFEAVSIDYSFTLKIDDYVPYICGAVHDGHNFRKDLWANCTHSEYERWFEEDPCTKDMVNTMPIVIAGRDSRFEYDLNRHPNIAVYEDAWGKALWKTPIDEQQHKVSLEKHTNFYKVVHALVSKIEAKFCCAIVYDMHSYNWKRWNREVPVINLGTTNINNSKYSSLVNQWRDSLAELLLPNNIAVTAAINDTFQGNGYFLKYITNHFQDTLVLATEFSKIYCDELTGIIFPEVVSAITTQLKNKIPQHADTFYRTFAT